MKKILFSLCAVVLLAAAAMAGGPAVKMHMAGGPGDKMHMAQMEEHLAKMLNLTEDQKATAKQLHQELMAKAGPLMEQQRQQWEEVHALLEGANPNPTDVGNKVIAAHAAGEQLKALHEDLKTRFSAVLTDEQKAKFEEIVKHHEEGGFPPRFGHGPDH
jgi:Spy/CpxP family protein refolding chaperone